MKVLAINCGSSSLKFRLFDAPGGQAGGDARKLAGGLIDRIGAASTLEFAAAGGAALEQAEPVADHATGVRRVFDWLSASGLLAPDGLAAVGHRVVQGADQFVEPTLIDDAVLEAIESLSDLAPLHNLPALAAMRGARSALGPAVPMVAVFDTAFHRTLPPRAFT